MGWPQTMVSSGGHANSKESNTQGHQNSKSNIREPLNTLKIITVCLM